MSDTQRTYRVFFKDKPTSGEQPSVSIKAYDMDIVCASVNKEEEDQCISIHYYNFTDEDGTTIAVFPYETVLYVKLDT